VGTAWIVASVTLSGRPGRPVAVPHGDTDLDLVARAADDSLLHVNRTGGNWIAHAYDAELAGDPTAAVTTDGVLHVFARGRGGWLLHWRTDPAQPSRLVRLEHGWRVAYDPVAVQGRGGSVGVYARSYHDVLLRWWSPDGQTWGNVENLGGSAVSDPAAVLTQYGRAPEVVVAGSGGALQTFGTRRVEPFTDTVYAERWGSISGGPAMAGPPVVTSWGTDRLDVLALTVGDSTGAHSMGHWGRAGFADHPEWFGVDPLEQGDTAGASCVVSLGLGHAMGFARNRQKRLVHWEWNLPIGHLGGPGVGWDGPTPVPADVLLGSAPGAVVRDGRAHVYAWNEMGTELVELVYGEAWTASELDIRWPGPEFVGASQRRVPITVDVVVGRPSDLVALGVSWEGFDLVDGEPPRLVRSAETGVLKIALPPQHVAEQVFSKPGPLVPPITNISDHGVWESVLSGPSQLVLSVAATEVELTTVGILDALRDAQLRVQQAGDPVLGGAYTEIELPWQLFLSPDGATASHRSEAPEAGTDVGPEVVPLWRSRLAADGSTSTPLRILRADSDDPFELPLGKGARSALRAVPSPATGQRLELSALGGTLYAHGRWPGLEWEHQAVVGRDHRVRVLMEGMLYPFGHRAQYLELSERFPPEPDGEPVAAIRKRRVLSVVEPVREYAGVRAFPFDRVTLTRTLFEGLDAPDAIRRPHERKSLAAAPGWQGRMREMLPPDGLKNQLSSLLGLLASMPPLDPVQLVEELGSFPGGIEEASPDLLALATPRLELVEQILDLQQAIRFAEEDTPEFVNEYFCPRRGGSWVEFPVTAEHDGELVSFDVPLVFVRDVNLPATETMQAFDSFDPGIPDPLPARLAREWASLRREAGTAAAATDPDDAYAGVVRLPGTSIDVVRAPAGQQQVEDVHVVHALHVTGGVVGREPVPRLGPVPGVEVPGPQWGMDIALPALKSLLPEQPAAHRALVAFTEEFERDGAAVEVALRLAKSGTAEAAKLLVDFTASTDRSGGLAAPKMAADVISRVAGPLNLEGLTDPAKLFDEGASILGVSLRDLLSGFLPDPATRPTITTDLTTPQPTVTLEWPTRDLQEVAPFGRKRPPEGAPVGSPPAPTITLKVTSCGPAVSSFCKVTDFSLSFPPSDPLIILNFDALTYDQQPGRKPAIDIAGLDVQFGGALDILKKLQGDAPQLAGQGPTLEVSEKGITAAYALPIPDVSSGVFVLRNLVFSTRVVVPFQGDPVRVAVAFASREKPFNLSVMMLGGGGYVDVEVSGRGLERLDIALEFGAAVAVDFVIASGEAHILGGIRFQLMPDESVELLGYLRIGGSLEILGLVTVSVELLLTLGYQSKGNRLVGRATLVIEIDLTIYSDSVEIDSGEWVLAGDDRSRVDAALPPPTQDDYDALWAEHQSARRRQR